MKFFKLNIFQLVEQALIIEEQLRRAAYLQITQKTEEQHMQKDAAEKAIAIGQDPVLASQSVADNSGKYFDFFWIFFVLFRYTCPQLL